MQPLRGPSPHSTVLSVLERIVGAGKSRGLGASRRASPCAGPQKSEALPPSRDGRKCRSCNGGGGFGVPLFQIQHRFPLCTFGHDGSGRRLLQLLEQPVFVRHHQTARHVNNDDPTFERFLRYLFFSAPLAELNNAPCAELCTRRQKAVSQARCSYALNNAERIGNWGGFSETGDRA